MVEPPIAARMEQAHYFASVRVNPRQIRAFTQVAVRTGESEIVCIVITTVLARSNVLYVEAQFGKFLCSVLPSIRSGSAVRHRLACVASYG
jgi:hypothetical protein